MTKKIVTSSYAWRCGPLIHHYDMLSLGLKSLSEGVYCRAQACSFTGNCNSRSEDERFETYLRLMAHASEQTTSV